MFQIVRYIANKPLEYNGEELKASGEVQYTRDDKNQAEQILNKLYDISANQKRMTIIKRTRYSFRCENAAHKYLFKIIKKTKDNTIEDITL